LTIKNAQNDLAFHPVTEFNQNTTNTIAFETLSNFITDKQGHKFLVTE
jgi:hypothetical protein